METVKIFRSYRDAMKVLAVTSKEQAYDYIAAVLDYGLDGIEPELEGAAAGMFLLTKPNLDVSIKKVEGNAAGGSKPKVTGKSPSSQEQVTIKSPSSQPQVTGKSKQVEEGSRKKEVGSRIKEVGDNPQKPPQGAAGADFEAFWQAYPNKTGKQAAEKEWSRLKPDAELTKALLQAVEYQKSWDRWQRGYIPNPSTWLHQQRWLDERPAEYANGKNVYPGQPPSEEDLEFAALMEGRHG